MFNFIKNIFQSDAEKRRAKAREYYAKNREKILAQCRARYEKNKDTILSRQKAARKKNPKPLTEERKAYLRQYMQNRLDNEPGYREKNRLYAKKWYAKLKAEGKNPYSIMTPEQRAAYNQKLREYRQANPERYKQMAKKYRDRKKQDPEYVAKRNAYYREYCKNRRKNDPVYAEKLRATARASYYKRKAKQQQENSVNENPVLLSQIF